MPHFILEYSANLEDELDLPVLFEKLHTTAIATGVFPPGGIRTRAVRCDQYRIANGDPELGFVHMTTKMGHGRPLEVRQEAGKKIFATLTEHLEPVFDTHYMGISFEIVELHPDLNFKINNIHEKLKKESSAA